MFNEYNTRELKEPHDQIIKFTEFLTPQINQKLIHNEFKYDVCMRYTQINEYLMYDEEKRWKYQALVIPPLDHQRHRIFLERECQLLSTFL